MLFLLQILSLLYHIAMTTIQPSLEPAIANPSQPHLPHFQHTNAPSAPNSIPTIPHSNDYNTTITRTGHHVHTFCRYLVHISSTFHLWQSWSLCWRGFTSKLMTLPQLYRTSNSTIQAINVYIMIGWCSLSHCSWTSRYYLLHTNVCCFLFLTVRN